VKKLYNINLSLGLGLGLPGIQRASLDGAIAKGHSVRLSVRPSFTLVIHV